LRTSSRCPASATRACFGPSHSSWPLRALRYVGPCPLCLTGPLAAKPPAWRRGPTVAAASLPPPRPRTLPPSQIIQLGILEIQAKLGSCDDEGASHPSLHPCPLSNLKPDPCIVAPSSPPPPPRRDHHRSRFLHPHPRRIAVSWPHPRRDHRGYGRTWTTRSDGGGLVLLCKVVTFSQHTWDISYIMSLL
jgi:hypothetical protein